MITTEPKEAILVARDQTQKAAFPNESAHSLQNLSRMLQESGITQSEIDTSIKVLKAMAKTPNATKSTTSSDEDALPKYNGLEQLRRVTARVKKAHIGMNLDVKTLYQILHLLPRNVYFSTRNVLSHNSKVGGDHPSLYGALMDHIDISRKELNQKLNIMRTFRHRFPLLVFGPPRMGLILVKNSVNDIVKPPSSSSSLPAPVAHLDQEDHPLYSKLKLLPRNTFFAMRPKLKQSLLAALNSVLNTDQNPEPNENKDFVMVDDEDNTKEHADDNVEMIEEKPEEDAPDQAKGRKKINARELKVMMNVIRNSPVLFPLVHFSQERFQDSPWIMIKSDMDVHVVGGPSEQSNGETVVVHSGEEANEIIEKHAKSIYNNIVLNLKEDVPYLHSFNIQHKMFQSINDVPEFFFRACKEIDPDLSKTRMSQFLKFYRKNREMFPRLKTADWARNKNLQTFTVFADNNINDGQEIIEDETPETKAIRFYNDIILKLDQQVRYLNVFNSQKFFLHANTNPPKLFIQACQEIDTTVTKARFKEFVQFYKKNRHMFPRLKTEKSTLFEEKIAFFVVDESESGVVIPDNDTKKRGGKKREMRMQLKRQQRLHKNVDDLTEKLESISNLDRNK